MLPRGSGLRVAAEHLGGARAFAGRDANGHHDAVALRGADLGVADLLAGRRAGPYPAGRLPVGRLPYLELDRYPGVAHLGQPSDGRLVVELTVLPVQTEGD